jgi:catechol 2,3-dioxygenase-like lactoylglutathione lyase family enzyme
VTAAGWTFEGYHHVLLVMPPGAEPQADEFYLGVLGFREIAKPPHLASRGGRWYRGSGLELHLGVDATFTPPSPRAHPALRVRGLDALRASLEAAGEPIEDDTQLEGHERCYVRDPFGNRLELIEETGP